jgi:hypothetical protein
MLSGVGLAVRRPLCAERSSIHVTIEPAELRPAKRRRRTRPTLRCGSLISDQVVASPALARISINIRDELVAAATILRRRRILQGRWFSRLRICLSALRRFSRSLASAFEPPLCGSRAAWASMRFSSRSNSSIASFNASTGVAGR